MMPRNLDRRVEAVVPVESPGAAGPAAARSSRSIWPTTPGPGSSDPDGTWHKVPTVAGVNAQTVLQELALARARRRREPDVLHSALPA